MSRSSTTSLFAAEGKYAAVPALTREAIIRWVDQGIRPGSFLCAIIKNDLRGAHFNADDENAALIPLYVRLFYWELPSGCCGSPAALENWPGLDKLLSSAGSADSD